jgi:benzoyl-CoA reductase/2-hydroxyglutaryl-CoA dehydratase subunit BcrC/BadD/HgdB
MGNKPATNNIRKLESAKLLGRVMTDYYHRLQDASDSPVKKLAWCTSVGPAELLYSMGFEVYFPENHAALIGTSKVADTYISSAVADGYSPDVCSYMTSDIGAFKQNVTPMAKFGLKTLPKPDILVFNNNQCCEVQHWLSFYARHFKAPIFGINTPHGVFQLTDNVIQYVSKQFRSLVPELEKVAGKKFDIDRFSETVELSRKACVLWRNVLETAVNKPSPINFFDASIHMGPIVVMRGIPAAVDYYEALLQELQERIKANVGAVPEERYRVYWEGMPVWGRLRALADQFARLKTCIVASTYCNSWIFDDLDPARPFESSALAYTELFIVRSDDVKAAR